MMEPVRKKKNPLKALADKNMQQNLKKKAALLKKKKLMKESIYNVNTLLLTR